MSIFGTILGVAGSLFGAKKESDARKRSEYNNSPQGIRANSEEAGFNPLVFAGPGVGTGAQYAPTFGNKIANAFAIAADGFDDARAAKLQTSQLEQENRRLNKLVQQTTLTPKVAGIYGNDGTQRQSEPRQQRTGMVSAGESASPAGSGDTLAESRAAGDGKPTAYSDRVTAPSVHIFGKTFYGSGAVGSAESFEESMGDPASWAAGLAVAGDIAGYSFGQYVSRKQQSKADSLMDEWLRRSREKDLTPEAKRRREMEKAYQANKPKWLPAPY